jgi:hypothetical protein
VAVTGQGRDELHQGSGQRSTTVPRWLSAAVLVLLVAGGLAVVFYDDGQRRADATPQPPPTSRSTHPSPSLDPALAITSSQDVCTKTDHQRRLTVSFGLVNLSGQPVVVDKVTPVLPLGGLRLTHQSLGLASCRQVFGAAQSRVLTAGGSLVVLFRFALPKDCPKPLPVEAEVTVSRSDGSLRRREPIRVLSDLGGLQFDQC